MSLPQIGLAPLMSQTDFPSRLWFAVVSAPSLVGAPFLRVSRANNEIQLPRGYAPEIFEMRDAVPYEVIPQVMASSSERFIEAASLLLRKARVVDLNCGCPSPTVVGRGGGSSLLENQVEFSQFLDDVAAGIGPAKVSIKMRVGSNSVDEFDALLAAVARHPWDRVTIHGRLRTEGYRGVARWDLVERASRICRSPVCGSGDICDLATWERVRQEAPSVNQFMVGRGALRNPWIFEELRSGRPTILSSDVIWHALALLGLLRQLSRRSVDCLVRWVDQGGLRVVAGSNLDAWREVVRQAAEASGQKIEDIADIQLDAQVMNNVKSVWHYLRSSLPPAFWGLRLMRLDRFQDFVVTAREMAAAEGLDVVTLRHEPQLDPRFTDDRAARSLL